MAKKLDKLSNGTKVSTFFISSDNSLVIMNLEVTDDKPVKIGGVDTIKCTNTNTQTTKTYSSKGLLKTHNDLVASGQLS